MSPQQDTLQTLEKKEPVRPALHDAIEAIVALAHDSASTQAFFRDAVPIIARALNAIYIALEVRHSASVTNETYCPDPDHQFWSKTIQNVLEDSLAHPGYRARLFKGVQVDLKLGILTAPIDHPGAQLSGAMVALVPCGDRQGAQEALAMLGQLVTLASNLSIAPESDGDKPGAGPDPGAMGALAKAARFSSVTELAYALTNKLRTRDGCDQVCLGSVQGKHVELLSISGLDDIKPRSPGVQRIRAAMEECLDFGSPVVQQAGTDLCSENIVTGARLHVSWHEATGGAPVASIPLTCGGQCVAILSTRRAKTATFSEEDLDDYRELVEPYAGALATVELANRSLIRHVRSSVREGIQELFRRANWGKKAVLAALTGFVLWALFGSVQYQVTVPCRIVPVDTRKVAAPFDGTLRVARVVPGDRVEAGDVLCELDSAELRLRHDQLQGELAMLRIDQLKALAAGAPSDEMLAKANRRAVLASVGLLELQIEQSVICSPVSGLVLEGDLRNRVGDVLTKGEPLFEISASDNWKLELEIPEDKVAFLAPAMLGRFASFSRPEDVHELQITTVRPSAELREGKNVFIAEARTDVDEGWIRSGVQGLGKVDVGERAPLWVAFHRILDYARLHLWL